MICTEYYRDEYIRDSVVWVARLSNGQIVYGDDGREGLERSSWKRLKQYVYENGLAITNLGVKFASHEEWPLPENQHGYYFSHGLITQYGASTRSLMTVGYIKDGVIHNHTFRCPELLEFEQEDRQLDMEQLADHVIFNPEIASFTTA